jgi:hypothetical protein
MSLRLTTACVAVVGIMAPDVVRAQNSGEPVNVVAPAGGAAPADGAAPAAAPMAPAGRKPLVSSAPPEPVAPAVITRDAEGNVTVRAVRAVAPIRVDGALDDRHYQEVTAMSDFIRWSLAPDSPRPSVPRSGSPSTTTISI